jgi:hypothetical protein
VKRLSAFSHHSSCWQLAIGARADLLDSANPVWPNANSNCLAES